MSLRSSLGPNRTALLVLEAVLAVAALVAVATLIHALLRGFFPRAIARSLGWALGFAVVAALASLLAFWHWRRARAIVDTPTSPIGGIALGPVEIQGRVEAIPDAPLERSRLDGRACVALEYRRTVGSGKHRRVVEQVDFCAPFRLVDDTGGVRVDLTGYGLDVPTLTRNVGNGQEDELAVAVGDTLYVMGVCETMPGVPASDDRLANLVVRKAPDRKGTMAGRNERAVLTHTRRRVALYAALAIVLLVLSVPSFVAANGFERAYATGALWELEKAGVTMKTTTSGWGGGACSGAYARCYGAVVEIANANPQHAATFDRGDFRLSYSYTTHDSKGTKTVYSSATALAARAAAGANSTSVALAFVLESSSSQVSVLDYDQPWIDAPIEVALGG
jgi:hypothetical protein